MASRGRPKKLTEAKILAAMDDCGGIISVVARRLGVKRDTVAKYIRENPVLQERVASECETFTDVAESSLMRLIREGNVAATIFYLKTKAKSRGYIERQEVQNVQPSTIEITPDEAAYFDEKTTKSK